MKLGLRFEIWWHRTIRLAEIVQSPIAPGEEIWDAAALVQYPNADAYLTMKATPEYQAARLHRQAALVDSRLIMSVEIAD